MRLVLEDAGFQFTNAKRPVRQPNADLDAPPNVNY
jgi:hypothetical protein